MKQQYHHLTSDNRTAIKVLLQEGKSKAYIADTIGVHKSTIYRELRRNKGKKAYFPKQAHSIASERKYKPRTKKLDEDVISYIIEKLERDDSPEQIAGNIFKNIGIQVSHETIYKLIYADKAAGGILYMHLRINFKRRYRKRVRNAAKGWKIRDVVSIDDRPKIVDTRRRFGDWEADLVCGAKQKGYLVTLLERKSGFVKIGHVSTRGKVGVSLEIIRLLSSEKVKTITFDNGTEFADHKVVAAALGCKCYFCHPYSSWERGSNENTNGLIRQYFPKGMELLNISLEEILDVEERLNSRPRKRLKFKSPLEIYKRAG